MQSLYLLIPVVLIMIGVAVGLLFWAVNSGQYDDLDKESRRILLQDESGNTEAGADHREQAGSSPSQHSPSQQMSGQPSDTQPHDTESGQRDQSPPGTR